ncbi:BUD32 protein kinase [Allomyces macrogynus ATCC 38327]|uniref:non-specific serine/threonine protein kinase n=1 Tax=Allomyces macrogynus (strain ATCC 38327) TaxID=578462 RepID=A0A0L0SUR7_ALLM3|nr:BUD32 protein kinase [Allomyces macrogynus ATCC 38327]|eukprot:KNE66130.1 BUD32 protein kinase [Allomyces macrogynus ATCC 38327]
MSGIEIIKQGAEGRLYRHQFLGTAALSKERFKKTYRHPTLDANLTRSRLLQEARALRKARLQAHVSTPRVLFVDPETSTLVIEEIAAPTVRDWVLTHSGAAGTHSADLDAVCDQIGMAVARLHGADLIHGDLTTSNMLVTDLNLATTTATTASTTTTPAPLGLCMIDFGLAATSTLAEDKAVDLYVLERAIKSTHPKVEKAMVARVLAAYESEATAAVAAPVLAKLDEVRLRGRKRSMVG